MAHLEEQRANAGLHVPFEIERGIERTKADIKRVEAELEEIVEALATRADETDTASDSTVLDKNTEETVKSGNSVAKGFQVEKLNISPRGCTVQYISLTLGLFVVLIGVAYGYPIFFYSEPVVPTNSINTTVELTSVVVLSPTPLHTPTPSPTLPPTCPAAGGAGTIAPAIAIYSITFLVNDVEQTVADGQLLQASPGDRVQVKDVTICQVAPVENGGVAFVEFDPVDRAGQLLALEVKGTKVVGITTDFVSIPGPDHTWIIGENWRHFSVVTIHSPPGGGTQDTACEAGTCEVDDRMIVPIG